MLQALTTMLPPLFAVSAILYLSIAVYVSRTAPRSAIAFFLLLIGTQLAGAAFSTGAVDPNLFGIGRALSFFAAGFLPVALYAIYCHYTDRSPGGMLMLVLSIIPIATTVLAVSNSLHGMVWSYQLVAGQPVFSLVTEHDWFTRVFAPFAYGLYGFSLIALAGRIPTLAPAHRLPVTVLVASAAAPFIVSLSNVLLPFGDGRFPFTAMAFTILLPVYAYLSVHLRAYEFSPVAYQTLFDHVRDPIIVLDNDQRIICVNAQAVTMLGTAEDELLGKLLWEQFPEAKTALNKAQDLDLTQTLNMEARKTYEINVAPLQNRRGWIQGTVVVCRDVTARRKTLNQLADSEHLIRTLVETSSNGILRFSRDMNDERKPFRCVFANRAAENHLCDAGGTMVGMPLDKVQQLEPQRLLKHFGLHERPSAPLSYEVESDGDDGEGWLRIVGEPVGEDISVTLIDITQRKRQEDQMLADALRDPLTGVLNRRGFEKEANHQIAANHNGAVLYLDLNQFKAINDTFGHQAGDALLKAFGHRLGYCLRPEDILGRLGGDEFAIVLPGVSVADAKRIAERLVRTSSEGYIIQGQEIKCTASVGIALIPQHGNELWHLVSIADQAMYKVKAVSAEHAANDCAAYIESAIAS